MKAYLLLAIPLFLSLACQKQNASSMNNPNKWYAAGTTLKVVKDQQIALSPLLNCRIQSNNAKTHYYYSISIAAGSEVADAAGTTKYNTADLTITKVDISEHLSKSVLLYGYNGTLEIKTDGGSRQIQFLKSILGESTPAIYAEALTLLESGGKITNTSEVAVPGLEAGQSVECREGASSFDFN